MWGWVLAQGHPGHIAAAMSGPTSAISHSPLGWDTVGRWWDRAEGASCLGHRGETETKEVHGTCTSMGLRWADAAMLTTGPQTQPVLGVGHGRG